MKVRRCLISLACLQYTIRRMLDGEYFGASGWPSDAKIVSAEMLPGLVAAVYVQSDTFHESDPDDFDVIIHSHGHTRNAAT